MNSQQFVIGLLCSPIKVTSKVCFIRTTNNSNPTKLFSSFSRLICLVFLLTTIASAHAKSIDSKDLASSPNGLVGAELLYHQLESGYVKVVLNKYYLCHATEFKKEEQVAIHDKAHIRLIKKLNLELESSDKIIKEETSECITKEESCYFKVSYSAKIYLTLSEQGFDATWGSTIVKGTIANLDRSSKQGISLLIHITNPWTDKKNQAPELKDFPLSIICGNQVASFNLLATDKDNDDTEVVLQDLFSHEVKEVREYYYDLDQKRSGPNLYLEGTDESFLTERPPFHKLKYSDCYSSTNPLCASEFSFDNTSKDLNLTAAPGKYLLGLSLKDFKNKKKISEHSMFLIITVK